MTDNVLHFPSRPQSVDDVLAAAAHLPEDERFHVLHRYVAGAMGRADDGAAVEWVATALMHLKERTSGHTDGGVEVSVAALHLVLGYIEFLEGRLGIIASPPGAA